MYKTNVRSVCFLIYQSLLFWIKSYFKELTVFGWELRKSEFKLKAPVPKKVKKPLLFN